MYAYRGRFRPGFDPRRHTFTQEQRRRGGLTRWRQIQRLQNAPGRPISLRDDPRVRELERWLEEHRRSWALSAVR
jgi:hypothetical protein